MKDFDVSTITTSGAQLLVQATEGNKLVMSGCEANTTVYTAETAKAVTAPTGTRISNEIELVSMQDNKIIVRARFTQSETTGGNANSLVLFGRLENDTEDTRTAICVVSNNAQFYLPSSTSEAVQDFECLFTIDYEIQSNVVVEQTSALECSLAEFRLLKERTVTSHKEGDPNVGDPTQNIFGEKVFQSQIGFVAEANFTSVATFNGGISVNGGAQFAEDATFKGNIILPDKTSDGFNAGNIQIGNLKALSTCATISQDGVSFECEEMINHLSTSYNGNGISIYGANAPSFTVNSEELSWSEPGQSNTRFKITNNGELFLYQKNDKTFALTATNRIDEVTLTTDYVVCRKSLTTPSVMFSGGETGKELEILPTKNSHGAQTKDLLFENCEKLQLSKTITGSDITTTKKYSFGINGLACDSSSIYNSQQRIESSSISLDDEYGGISISNNKDDSGVISKSNVYLTYDEFYGYKETKTSGEVPLPLGRLQKPWGDVYCTEVKIVSGSNTKDLSTCVDSLSGTLGKLSLSKIDNTKSSINVKDLIFKKEGSGNAAKTPAGLTLLFVMSKSDAEIVINAGESLSDLAKNGTIAVSESIDGDGMGSPNFVNVSAISLSKVVLSAGAGKRHPVLVWITRA